MAKKESLKKSFEKMMEAAQPVYQYTANGVELTESSVKAENFRASFVHTTDDRQQAEDYIRYRVRAIERGHVVSKKALERRSSERQKALAYISEHRHLIPFFRFLYEQQRDGSLMMDAVKAYKKAHKVLPSELVKETVVARLDQAPDHYHLGTGAPLLVTVVDQVPIIPKAWML